MKICIVTGAFYPATYYGGPIFSIYNSARCLAKNGFHTFVLTTNTNGKNKLDITTNKYLELDQNLSVKYYSGGTATGFSLRMFLSLWKDINGMDFIYLISIFSPTTPLVLLLNIFFKKPLILSPRGQLGEWCLMQGSIFKKTWLKIFISPVANIITWAATSLSEKEMIKIVYPGARVEVIPSIINVEEFNVRSSERSYSIYSKLTEKNFEGKKIIVSLGRLHKVKGFDILIEAIAKVEKDDIVLLIAGEDFGERKKLEEIIDKFKLKDKVFLIGLVEGKDKIEFLRNADLFALASHHENFGIVYAEALASGIPVVASKNTPWQEVEKFNCGLWVENTPEDFANAFETVLKDDRKIMGENGRKFITERFSCNSIIKKYQSVFNTILD